MKKLKLGTFCLFLLSIACFAAFNRAGLAAGDGWMPQKDGPANICSWPPPFLPSEKDADAFETFLSDYVRNGCYKKSDSGWKSDSEIRDTGLFFPNDSKDPSAGGKTFGTHNAVRVYYSPEVWKWLNSGRKDGDLHDGATIIKEMYPAPAQQKVASDLYPCGQSPTGYSLRGYAIMVKDKKGSWDGWFWSDGCQKIDYSGYPNAGFGLYCINCHASAQAEVTFSASRNILGDPMVFNQTMPPFDVSKQKATPVAAAPLRAVGIAPAQQLTPEEDVEVHLKRSLGGKSHERSRIDLVRHAPGIAARAAPNAAPTPKTLVSEWYDTVTQNPQGQKARAFVTSNQCFGCHDATQNNASIPNMVYPQIYTVPDMAHPRTSGLTKEKQKELDLNLSPYGEWRSSMMGLSGRDPVFYAQLETELNLHPEIREETVNTCLSCHGVMGQRQITLDKKGPFKLEYLDRYGTQPHAEYGGLARDGVSCAVCHHIAAEGLGTPATYTGKFKLGKPDEIYGPYDEVVKVPMKNGLGLTPLKTKENQIKSSALCGSCHTVILPVLKVGEKYPSDVFDDAEKVERGDKTKMGGPGEPVRVEHEQNTYLEWLNSKYQNERPPFNPATVQTCQDCHMPANYPSKTGAKLQFKVASIEEETFAAADFRAPDADIHLRVRGQETGEPFSRHTLLGMNIFTLKMFAQNADTLGVAFTDPMATYGNGVPSLVAAQKSALELARSQSAEVQLTSLKRTAKGINTQVQVTNITGHKFPSGVSFRRAFIELRVESGGKTLWVSGATNPKGVIGTMKGGKFTPLVTEYFDRKSNPQQQYQRHFDAAHPITSEDEVQIYEELVKDTNGFFTTSFLSLDDPVKDNRMMPQGWRRDGPEAADTKPLGVDERSNPGYFDGSGTSVVAYDIPLALKAGQKMTVTATIYYQTIPPYYQEQRYAGAPNGVFTQSFKYYVDTLKVGNVEDDCAANEIDPDFCKLMLGEAPVKDWKLMIVRASRTF
jgi:hypothetical protein